MLLEEHTLVKKPFDSKAEWVKKNMQTFNQPELPRIRTQSRLLEDNRELPF
jgi:hypothetical protein